MTKRILLCDDEIHILRAAEFKLKKAGYDVHIASDGQEAWEAIQNQKPDMLITDCQMPRLDGLGLVARVRENPETADLPIFMLTAKGFELSHDNLAKKWNVMAVIAKPFSPRELLQRVDTVLGGSGVAKPQAEIDPLPSTHYPPVTQP
jgi:two-component system, OmpR family, alkaline phosphatase synthesis response regulator PhoP